jgi:hypothetical protein
MKTEKEINDKIHYTQGYLDGLWFALGRTDAEVELKESQVRVQEDAHIVKEREASRLFAPIGITAGLATFFFGFALQPRHWFDMWAGIVMVSLGFIGAGIYFHLLKKSLEH